MSRSETKSQLKQIVEELKRQLTDSQRQLSEAEMAKEDATRARQRLQDELRDTQRRLEETSQALSEAEEELAAARDRLGELEPKDRGDLSEPGHRPEVEELTLKIEKLQRCYEEAEDLSHRKEWEMEQLRSQSELATLKAKESLREELQTVHARELKVRDDLIHMLRARLAELEGQPSKAAQATVKVSFAQKEPQDEESGGSAKGGGGPSGHESVFLGESKLRSLGR